MLERFLFPVSVKPLQPVVPALTKADQKGAFDFAMRVAQAGHLTENGSSVVRLALTWLSDTARTFQAGIRAA
jgi:hypothetical protein